MDLALSISPRAHICLHKHGVETESLVEGRQIHKQRCVLVLSSFPHSPDYVGIFRDGLTMGLEQIEGPCTLMWTVWKLDAYTLLKILRRSG